MKFLPCLLLGRRVSAFGGFGMQAAKFLMVSVSSIGACTVESVFIGHIPIRKNDHARWQSLTLSSLFGVSDFEVNVIAILEVMIESALKSIRPFCVVLDDVFEVVEELAVGINTSNFNVGASVPDEITLEEPNTPAFQGRSLVDRTKC
jgi:hypothetical protein